MIRGVYLPLTLMTGTLPGLCVSGSLGLSPFSTLLLMGVGLLLELGLAPVTLDKQHANPFNLKLKIKILQTDFSFSLETWC